MKTIKQNTVLPHVTDQNDVSRRRKSRCKNGILNKLKRSMTDNLFVVLMILLMVSVASVICFDLQKVFIASSSGKKDLAVTQEGVNVKPEVVAPIPVTLAEPELKSDVDIYAPKFEPIERAQHPMNDEDLPFELRRLRDANFKTQPLQPQEKGAGTGIVVAK